MHEVVASLQSAIQQLTALDHSTLSDHELHEITIALQQSRARLAVACAPTLESWDRRHVWADNGSLSAAARLSRECRTSLATATTELRRARNLDAMPATRAAIDDFAARSTMSTCCRGAGGRGARNGSNATKRR